MNIRSTVAERIQAEIDRRGLNARDLAKISQQPTSVIKAYLKGSRELNLNILKDICDAIGINLLTFLSTNYTTPTIQYRNHKKSCREAVQRIENALQIIHDQLPSPLATDLERPSIHGLDRITVTQLAADAAKETTLRWGNKIESIYDELKIPIIPVQSQEFEAFIYVSGDKSAVCCNIDTAHPRLHFTLAHELCHFIFDKNTGAEIDLNHNYFCDSIILGKEREFFATKFSQFFLIPLEVAERWANFWPEINPDEISSTLKSSRCSLDVAINSIYDALQILRKKVDIKTIQDTLNNTVRTHPVDGIIEFLHRHHIKNNELINLHSDCFSPDIFSFIKRQLLSWKIESSQPSSTRIL